MMNEEPTTIIDCGSVTPPLPAKRRKRSLTFFGSDKKVPAVCPEEPSSSVVAASSSSWPSASSEDLDGAAVSASEQSKAGRNVEYWDDAGVKHFLDALKQYGRDFPSIRDYFKRRIKKDVTIDRLRNFYYNTLKQVSSGLNLGEVNAPKDAKEMFTIICALEWRMKLGVKPISDGLQQLIISGVANVRVKRKQKTIRVPVCPALGKFCTVVKKSPPTHAGDIPSDVLLELVPKTFADRAYVIRCEQNPFVRLKLHSTHRLRSYLRMLSHKWLPPDLKTECILGKRDVDGKLPIVTLYASKATSICDVKLVSEVEAQTTGKPPPNISLERCAEVFESGKKGDMWENGEGSGLDSGCDSNDAIVAADTAAEAQKSGGKPADLTEESTALLEANCLVRGVSIENVGQLTAANLFLLCNRSQPIRLIYSVEHESIERAPHAWKLLLQILKRDYGDAILSAVDGSSAVPTAALHQPSEFFLQNHQPRPTPPPLPTKPNLSSAFNSAGFRPKPSAPSTSFAPKRRQRQESVGPAATSTPCHVTTFEQQETTDRRIAGVVETVAHENDSFQEQIERLTGKRPVRRTTTGPSTAKKTTAQSRSPTSTFKSPPTIISSTPRMGKTNQTPAAPPSSAQQFVYGQLPNTSGLTTASILSFPLLQPAPITCGAGTLTNELLGCGLSALQPLSPVRLSSPPSLTKRPIDFSHLAANNTISAVQSTSNNDDVLLQTNQNSLGIRFDHHMFPSPTLGNLNVISEETDQRTTSNSSKGFMVRTLETPTKNY